MRLRKFVGNFKSIEWKTLTFFFWVWKADSRKFRIGLLLLFNRDVRREPKYRESLLYKKIADSMHGGVYKLIPCVGIELSRNVVSDT